MKLRLAVGAAGILCVGIGLGMAILINAMLWRERERERYITADPWR